MHGFAKLTCDGCGRPADVTENTVIYKCDHCKSVYERIVQPDGQVKLMRLEDAMERLLPDMEFLTAEACTRTLPELIRDQEAALTQIRADLDAEKAEEVRLRQQALKAQKDQRDLTVGCGVGAVVAFILALAVSGDTAILFLVLCVVAVGGAWYNYDKWRKLLANPDPALAAATKRVTELQAQCDDLQDELEQMHIQLDLRRAQVKTYNRRQFTRPPKR